jgi:hypothetical protein
MPVRRARQRPMPPAPEYAANGGLSPAKIPFAEADPAHYVRPGDIFIRHVRQRCVVRTGRIVVESRAWQP